MRILFILELYHPNIGGNERLFRSLAGSLVAEGHEVTVLTTRFRRDLPTHEVFDGATIRRLPVRNRFLFTLLAIYPAIRLSRKADLVHTTSYNAAFPAWLAARLTRRKVVITFHEAWGKLWFRLPYLNFIQKRLFYRFEQFILHLKFDRFVAVSDYTRECLEQNKVDPEHIIRIYNGLDYAGLQKHNPGHPPRFTFTYFGRPGSSKGLDIILEAVPAFINEHPGSRLKLILSRSPEKVYNMVTSTLKQKLGSDNLTVLSDLGDEDLIRELLSSSCIIIPSYSEGFCYAAAESIALGIPLVHSNRGALKEVVSGKHIPMDSQDPPGLFRALEKAINGEWEEKPLIRFDLRETVDEYIRLYESILT